MRILLTNDDGYNSNGIRALFNALIDADHDVTIVAPETNSSGMSQSIAVYSPIGITCVDERIYYVSSTPADSVRLGLQAVFQDKNPQLVLSGINHGENISEDVFYSGTVGAAREAALRGIPGIAISTSGSVFKHLDAASLVVVDLIKRIERNISILNNSLLWNVNIPNRPYNEIGSFEATKLGTHSIHRPLTPSKTPRGDTMYWHDGSRTFTENEIGTDVLLHNEQKNVSITPLSLFPTDYSQMSTIAAVTV